MTVAALYTAPRGIYSAWPGVEAWGLPDRDARDYAGPWPVVAHPPCSRWCQLAGLVEARWGHRRGDDGGCFASALAAVRRWGGVLEHPAFTAAWPAFGLPRPRGYGVWEATVRPGEWVLSVNQADFGHPARKRTWLLYHGARAPLAVPVPRAVAPPAVTSFCRNHGSDDRRPRLTKKQASATPPAFAAWLVALAEGATD